MKEKGEEIKDTPNSENINNISNSTNSSSSNQDIKTPPTLINPEFQQLKSNNSKPKVEKPVEEKKFKIEIPNRQRLETNEDMEKLIDISNEIEMITDELKETFYDDLLNKQDMSLL